MKFNKTLLAALVAFAFMGAAHASNNAADAAAAFQQFHEAAVAFNTLPDNAPLNQFNDQYSAAVAGLNRLGIAAGEQGDLIANVHNLATVADLSLWIGHDVVTPPVAETQHDAPNPPLTHPSDEPGKSDNTHSGNQVTPDEATPDAKVAQTNNKRAASRQYDQPGNASDKTDSNAYSAQQNASQIAKNAADNDKKNAAEDSQIAATTKRVDDVNTVVSDQSDRISDVERQATSNQTTNIKQDAQLKDADARLQGDELAQMNRDRTASQHVTEEPHNGIDGKTGAQGEKGDAGVTTTITKVQTDTATQTQVAQNQTTLRHVQEEQTAQGEYVQHMNQTVSHTATLAASNSQRLNAVESHQKSLEQQQSNDREEYRAGIAGAVAISGLHYTETDNSVAIGAGDFKNEQGYALGYRHKFSDNVATTVAASETSNGDAMFSASAAIGW